MSENVVILGATSGIAQALCRVLAARGCKLVLAGRRTAELDTLAADLQVRYQVEALVESFDALDESSHASFVERCVDRCEGELAGVVLAFGYLVDESVAHADPAETRRTIDVNFTSAALILNRFATYFEGRKSGYIAGISSVAGDRGRQSNYTYGAAKAGLSAYLEGLRNRLYHAGVHVLTIKPGFVDTAMTHGKLNPKSPLVASPERVARDIDRAIRRRKNVLYTPWFWRIIMGIIRTLPEPIFKRLKL